MSKRVLHSVFLGSAVLAFAASSLTSQVTPRAPISQVWTADQGDGNYRNPILYADYSDPDVTRVGDTFYLVSSSFNQVPGLPILASKDLVNWTLVAHVFDKQPPLDVFDKPQHGKGAWAPSIRYHAGNFYIFYPDPDYGIYMTKAKSATGPWSTPLLIKAARGWIDPCPLWDDDGNAYLVSALANSRAHAGSVIVLSRMASDATSLLDEGSIVIEGHGQDPTIEGPKIYKRNGFYYISAPAGGVPTGWQVVFRSKKIYGPYERKVTLAQGSTAINGPHQGAWVDTPAGEDWFLHFQDQGAYGRVVLLEPMHWTNDWPVMGQPRADGGPGEPVSTYRKPRLKSGTGPVAITSIPDSDEFNAPTLGPQWQWEANPQPGWAFPSAALGSLRLSNVWTSSEKNLWNVPNLLLQKFPGPSFTVTTKVNVTSRFAGEETGLLVLGQSYAYLGIRNTGNGLEVRQVVRDDAEHGGTQTESAAVAVPGTSFQLRATVEAGANVTFSYSPDGVTFLPIGSAFHAKPGRWVGARIGLFALGSSATGEFGYADYDWFRFTK